MEFVKKDLINCNISEHKLQSSDFCNNDNDLKGICRNITEDIIKQFNEYIKSTQHSTRLIDASKIKKFKDLCDENIIGRHFSEKFHLFLELNPIIDYYKTYSNFVKYCMLIFIILGLLGNCLSAIVLFRKKMRSFSSNIYLGVLAISDIAYLMILLIDWLIVMVIYAEGNYLYQLYFFMDFLRCFSEFLSAWLIVASIIERYIVTKYPLLHQFWCTIKQAKIIVIKLTGLAILRSMVGSFFYFRNQAWYRDEVVFKTKFNFSDIYKYIKLNSHGSLYTRNIIKSVIIFIGPTFAIVMYNILIGYHIYEQNRVRKTLITASNSFGRALISSDQMLQRKITKMLILVSSIFVILKLPQCYFFYIPSDKLESVNIIYVLVMSMTFNLLNTAHYSINFVLYCAMGQTFRRELIRMFTKRTI